MASRGNMGKVQSFESTGASLLFARLSVVYNSNRKHGFLHFQMEKEKKVNIEICAACLRDNDNVEAKHWCCDCAEALCEDCGKVHKKSRFTTSHKLIRLRDVKNTKSFLMATSFLCDLHSDLRVTFYCNRHDQLICQTCLLQTHKDCKYITAIEQLMPERPRSSSNDHFDVLQKQALKLADSLNQLINTRKDNLANLDQQNQTIQETIKKTKSEIIDHLTKLEEELLNSLSVKYDSCVEQIDDEISQLQHNKDLMSIHDSDIELMRKNGSEPYKFTIVKKFEQTKPRTEDIISNFRDRYKPLEIDFTQNEEQLASLYNAMGWVDIKVINRVKSAFTEKTTSPRPTSKQWESPTESKIVPRPVSTRSVSNFKESELSLIKLVPQTPSITQLVLYKKFPTSSSLGENITVSRGCFISGKHMLLCDAQNRFIFVCNLYGSMTEKIPLLYFPHDVALFDRNTAVVAAGERGIQVFDITDSECRPDRFIRPGGKCTAISCIDDQIIVRSGHCKISILDRAGISIFKINTKYDPLLLSAGINGSIYWTSNNGDEVQCIARERSQFICRSETLVGPSGLATDGAGHVFVAGYESGNIHRLSNRGTKSMVLDEGIYHPWGLAFDQDSQRLMIINDDGVSIDIYTVCK